MGPFENSFNPKKPGAKTGAKTAGQPPLFNVPLDNPYVGSYKSMTRTNRLDYKSSNRLKTIRCVKIRIPASIYFPISLPLSKNINYMFSSFLYLLYIVFFSFFFFFLFKKKITRIHFTGGDLIWLDYGQMYQPI